MPIRKTLCVMAIVLLHPLPGRAQKAGKVENQPIPTELVTTPWIIGSETRDQWEGLLPTVNAPNRRTRAYPGQHLTVAIAAQGKDRDALLRSGTYAFTVRYGGSSKAFSNLRPCQTRRIKAEGADFVKYVMEQTQVDAKGLEDSLSMVSLALFDLDWQVPPDAKDGEATFQGAVTGPDGKTLPLKESSLSVCTFDRSVQEGDFKDQKAAGEWEMTYYQHPEPARILNSIRLLTDDPNGIQPNIRTFYIEVLKSSPLAERDLLRRLPKEQSRIRLYGLLLLKEAGYDLTSFLSSLPEAEKEGFSRIVAQVPPLPDPYDLSVNLADPYQITTRMDMLWSRFLATGDQKPVRAVADVLQWREDGRSLLALRKSGKKIDGITPGVLHGLAYSAGGWSLGSFFRHHPVVADYIDAWKQDPKTPVVIKEELGTLITNEAFKAE